MSGHVQKCTLCNWWHYDDDEDETTRVRARDRWLLHLASRHRSSFLPMLKNVHHVRASTNVAALTIRPNSFPTAVCLLCEHHMLTVTSEANWVAETLSGHFSDFHRGYPIRIDGCIVATQAIATALDAIRGTLTSGNDENPPYNPVMPDVDTNTNTDDETPEKPQVSDLLAVTMATAARFADLFAKAVADAMPGVNAAVEAFVKRLAEQRDDAE